jgi:hypothetical protein
VVKGTFEADGAIGNREGGPDSGAWTSHMSLLRVLSASYSTRQSDKASRIRFGEKAFIDVTGAEESAEYNVVITSAVSH